MDSTTLLLVLAVLLVAVGIGGLILPLLPGAPLVFAGLLLAAWAEDFAYVGAPSLVLIAVLALLSYVADLAGTALGARRYGASRQAMTGAVLGGVVGIFFGLPGVLLGPFIGALAGEYRVVRDLRQAGRAGIGATLGLALAVALKMSLALAMIGTWILARFVI